MGREPILLNILVGSPGEALLVSDHLQVYLEMLEGIDLIPVVVGDRSELASSLSRFGDPVAMQDIANGEGGEHKAMLLPQMMGQPEAAEAGGFPFLHHQLFYLFGRLARRAHGPSR